MPKARRYSVIARPYGQDVVLYRDKDHMVKCLYRRQESRDEFRDGIESAYGVCTWENGTVSVGVFSGAKCTLVHELVHAGIKILERAGIDPLHANGEPLAYLVEDLYQRLEKHV